MWALCLKSSWGLGFSSPIAAYLPCTHLSIRVGYTVPCYSCHLRLAHRNSQWAGYLGFSFWDYPDNLWLTSAFFLSQIQIIGSSWGYWSFLENTWLCPLFCVFQGFLDLLLYVGYQEGPKLLLCLPRKSRCTKHITCYMEWQHKVIHLLIGLQIIFKNSSWILSIKVGKG